MASLPSDPFSSPMTLSPAGRPALGTAEADHLPVGIFVFISKPCPPPALPPAA